MMKRFLCLLLSVFIMLSMATAGLAVTEEDFHAYFEVNALPSLLAFTEELSAKNILIMGEHHGVADNYSLYLDILRHFPEDHIQLVLEMSPSFAFLCGEYLQTGNETLLKNAIGHLAGTFGYSKEHFAFWQQVRQLAQQGKRIDAIGVDQEFQLKNAALALLTIDQERFEPVLQRINTAGAQGTDALVKELATIVQEHEGLPIESKKDQAVQDIMLSLGQLLKNPMGDKERDVPLYQTFVRRVKPDVRTLGIFGGQHTTKTAQAPTLVSQLMQDDPFRGQVAVAQLFYVDASYMDARSGQALPLQGLTKDSVIVQHAQRQREKVAIYRLPASPLFEGPDVQGLALPDLYDFAFLMENAKATRFLAGAN